MRTAGLAAAGQCWWALVERDGDGACNPAVDGEKVAVVGSEVSVCRLHRLRLYHHRGELMVTMVVGDQGVPLWVDVEFHRPYCAGVSEDLSKGDHGLVVSGDEDQVAVA